MTKPQPTLRLHEVLSNDTVTLEPRQWSSVFEAVRFYAAMRPVDKETKKPVNVEAIGISMLKQLGVEDFEKFTIPPSPIVYKKKGS